MKHHEDIRSYDASATALAFPLGGIGTGNVSLGARGEWRDWEIFNLPAKGARLAIELLRDSLPASGRGSKRPRAGGSSAAALH